MKINLGAGSDIRDEYVNHDITKLPGIDVVHDLNVFPWPWEDNSTDEIVAKDIIEHLDDFMAAMEEIHRILVSGGVVRIKVPYWNSVSRYADPTHQRGFHEITFKFFDPTSIYCQERHYYTRARFLIAEESFVVAPFTPYFAIPGVGERRITGRWAKRFFGLIGNILSNIILDLEVVLEKAN
ncbi:MAG: methyltransferase domain-containing protein [Proteobacteria bacterium]|nr:methyltransferase domain-containing protein [Pseudomonadota bacterium]NOG59089.1 methyltransferase domain-containing protein [Pseudomonadota bacterium]